MSENVQNFKKIFFYQTRIENIFLKDKFHEKTVRMNPAEKVYREICFNIEACQFQLLFPGNVFTQKTLLWKRSEWNEFPFSEKKGISFEPHLCWTSFQIAAQEICSWTTQLFLWDGFKENLRTEPLASVGNVIFQIIIKLHEIW
jgi:hypothetical protein